MEVLGCGNDLEHQGFDLRGEEGFGHVIEEGFEIVFEEIHYEVDAVMPNCGGGMVNNVWYRRFSRGSGLLWCWQTYSFNVEPMTTSRK